MLRKIIRYGLFFLCYAVTPPIINAHNGESHDHKPTEVLPKQSSELRLQKTGDVFEIVVVISPKENPNAIIYLSDPDSNRPIGEAEITLEVNSTNTKADKTNKKGIYQANIPLNHQQSIGIDIHKETFKEKIIFENIAAPVSSDSTHGWFWKIGLALLVLGGLGYLCREKIISKLKALFAIGVLLLLSIPNVQGHGDNPHHKSEKRKVASDDDHDHHPHVIAGSPVGLVVPKELQFNLGIVTEKASEKTMKGSIRLVGAVISDPSGYARIQATQTARIINHPDYPLPLPGQPVKVSQVVLAVAPTLTTIESTEQKNALYKAESEITQRQLEVQRLEKLGQYAAKKDLDNAKAELERALKQQDEIANQTFKPEFLRSPIDGFVSDLHVRPGEIVTSDKTIVEIVDPSKLMVEALVFNPEIAGQITGGYIFSPLKPDKTIGVKILGVSPKVNREDQSIHIQLKLEKVDPDIKLDMAVEVVGELKETKPALVIPQKAVAEDSQGSWVFIHTNPETFEPRKIRIKRQLDDMVEIEEGLSPGERIVTEGAYLLNQAK